MASWLDALARTRKTISSAIGKIFSGTKKPDPATLEEFEAVLLQADIPARIVMEMVDELESARGTAATSLRDTLRSLLLRELGDIAPFVWSKSESPHVILVVGINGSGKTTTCAKLAHLAKSAGLTPLLGAWDTFRAAGSEQVRIWAERVGCAVVAGATGGDAAAVAYDSIHAASSSKADVVIFDTAGRMHTKEPLMQELQKVKRAMGKRLPGAPHETWLVLDASMGQNAISQAKLFHEAVPLTGVVVSKLDGSAKAGFLFGLKKELGVPVRFVGLGEGMDDLAPFEPAAFVDALLDGSAEAKEGLRAEAGA